MNNLTPVVKNLIIINCLFFLATLFVAYFNQIDLTRVLGIYYPTSPYFRPYQVATHFFMHGGLTHIFFNMFALGTFGIYIERMLGGKHFFVYYIVCALGATLTHFAFNAFQIYVLGHDSSFIELIPMVGASGAIFGVLMAFGMFFPETQLMLMFPPIPVKGKQIAVISLVLGVLIDFNGNVAHFAHLGGMIFGYLLLKYWKIK